MCTNRHCRRGVSFRCLPSAACRQQRATDPGHSSTINRHFPLGDLGPLASWRARPAVLAQIANHRSPIIHPAPRRTTICAFLLSPPSRSRSCHGRMFRDRRRSEFTNFVARKLGPLREHKSQTTAAHRLPPHAADFCPTKFPQPPGPSSLFPARAFPAAGHRQPYASPRPSIT